MTRDEALHSLAEAVRLLNETLRSRADHIVDELRSQAQRRQGNHDDIRERLGNIERAIRELLEDVPAAVLRRMDRRTLDALRQARYLQDLQGTPPSEALSPPPGAKSTIDIADPDERRDITGVFIPIAPGHTVRVSWRRIGRGMLWAAKHAWYAALPMAGYFFERLRH